MPPNARCPAARPTLSVDERSRHHLRAPPISRGPPRCARHHAVRRPLNQTCERGSPSASRARPSS
eukprot:2603145-Pyramimonas_sp.AAC.1